MTGYFTQEGNYLMHHGILGMKWGVRRYQNKDGSYTAEGKKRYGVSGRKKKTSNLSDAERKAKRKKLAKRIAIGAVVAGAAAGMTVYALKKKSGKRLPSLNTLDGIKTTPISRASVKRVNPDTVDVDNLIKRFSENGGVYKKSHAIYDSNPRRKRPGANKMADDLADFFGLDAKERSNLKKQLHNLHDDLGVDDMMENPELKSWINSFGL